MGKKSKPKPITSTNDVNSKAKLLSLLNLNQSKDQTESSSSSDQTQQKKKISKATKRKLHQKFITRFHTINKELANDPNLTVEKRSMLENEKKELGGLETYQKASVKGEKLKGKFQTSKWFVKQIQEQNCQLKLIIDRKEKNKQEGKQKLKLLDVGALDENYAKQSSWIDCTSIGKNLEEKEKEMNMCVCFRFNSFMFVSLFFLDLHSQHPSVKQMDFFDFKLEDESQPLDVLCLSLVLNFVGSFQARGEMLRRCKRLLKQDGGILFIVLPLPCVSNSRYMNHELFIELLSSLSFKLHTHHFSAKLAFYIFEQSTQPVPTSLITKDFKTRKLVRKGLDRNNFWIML